MCSAGFLADNTFLSVYQGNLDERCSDALIWELMLQAGPVGELLTELFLDDWIDLLSRLISQCAPAEGPHLYGPPRLWIL